MGCEELEGDVGVRGDDVVVEGEFAGHCLLLVLFVCCLI